MMKFSVAILFALLLAFTASPAAALRGGSAKDNKIETEGPNSRALETHYEDTKRNLKIAEATENFRKLVEAEKVLRNLLESGDENTRKLNDPEYRRDLVQAEAQFHAFAEIHESNRKLFGDDDLDENNRALGGPPPVLNDDQIPEVWKNYPFKTYTNALFLSCIGCWYYDDDSP